MNHEKRNQQFENPFGNIFNVVQAEGSDTVASPTLPIDPNLRGNIYGIPASPTPEVTPPPGKSSISIRIDGSSTVKIGETVKIIPTITSNSTAIKSFKIVIKYDNSKLEATSNTYTDTYFTQNKSIDIANGTVTISAEANGDARTINRPVAEIQFKVNSAPTKLTVEKLESNLINDAGENILEESQDLTIQTSGTVTPEASQVVEPPVNGNKHLPKSDLNTIIQWAPAISGTLLISLGFLAFRYSRKNRHESI